MNNTERSLAAQHAIDTHRDHVRDYEQEPHQQLIDLLTNLRHWASDHGLDFADACRVSNIHFKADVES